MKLSSAAVAFGSDGRERRIRPARGVRRDRDRGIGTRNEVRRGSQRRVTGSLGKAAQRVGQELHSSPMPLFHFAPRTSRLGDVGFPTTWFDCSGAPFVGEDAIDGGIAPAVPQAHGLP